MKIRIAAIGIIAFAWGGTAQAQLERVSIDAALHTSDKPYIQAAGEATIFAYLRQVNREAAISSEEFPDGT